MKQTLVNYANFNKKDLINSTSATALSEVAGEKITVTKCAILKREESDGNERTVFVLGDNDGNYYSGISETVIRVCDDIIDMLADNQSAEGVYEPIEIIPRLRKTKAGRDFLTVVIL